MKFEENILYYLFINIAPGLGAILAYLFNLHKHQLGKYIFYLLLLSFSIETMVEIHFQLNLGRNIFFNSIARILSLTIIGSLIYEFTGSKRSIKQFALMLMGIVLVFLLFVEGFNNYAPMAYSLEELSVILLCFYYFYYVFQHETEILVPENPVFVFICGILIYHCGSLFTSIMILRITEDLDTYILYDLQLVFDGLMNFGLIAILLVINRAQKKATRTTH